MKRFAFSLLLFALGVWSGHYASSDLYFALLIIIAMIYIVMAIAAITRAIDRFNSRN